MKCTNAVFRIGPSAASIVILMLAAACGSGAHSAPATGTAAPQTAAAPDLTTRPLTDADAMNLTLMAAQFDPGVADYLVSQSTAPILLSDLQGDPCTADELASLTQLGFERGYNRDWVRPDDASTALDLSVGSYIEIYPDATAAAGRLAYDKKFASAPLPPDCDVTIQSSSTFPVSPAIGDEVIGYRKTIPDEDGRLLTYTWVEFRTGRIVANTDVIRQDSNDTSAKTARYAKQLEAHIIRLLSAPE